LLARPLPAPDLVLADVQMPGTTGTRLVRKLRRACGPTTILLAISGSQPSARAISLFDGFLMKPFNMEQVAALLARSHPTIADSLPKRDGNVAPSSVRTSSSHSKPIAVFASTPEVASKPHMNVQIREPETADDIVTESAGIPILNETIYRQLAASIPAAQLQEMYSLCVNDARKRIGGMRALAANRDSVQFIREAHTLKGGCGMLGATELHRMAARLEANGLDLKLAGQAHDVRTLDELSAACDRLERMLGSRT